MPDLFPDFNLTGRSRHPEPVDLRKTVLLWLVALLCCGVPGYKAAAQLRYRVLFLGNSYTGVNNLPQLVRDVALSAGDTLLYDSHTPGGYQLADHQQDPLSQGKIMAGGWDYVVLQGQSQEPVVRAAQFSSGGLALYNLVKQHNPCAVVALYMTWGRKNGDAEHCAAFPLMCTYAGMDTTLRDRYLNLASSLNSEVSPVSVVWRYLRAQQPAIELYQADESHPSLAGSYAAACCFYTVLFKKDPALITSNAGLNAAQAALIRNAVRTQVFDNLSQWDFKRLPVSAFSYQAGPGNNEITFSASGAGVRQTYAWDFGDGATSSLPYAGHTYATNGTYTVSLTTATCDLQGLHSSTTDTVIQLCSHTPTIYTLNPWLCHHDTLRTQPADAYQWYVQGQALPETGPFLPGYARYGSSGFSVRTTINGCAELSVPFAGTAVFSGYYFDATGDPCRGDTVAFALRHIDGMLPGTEHIFWYKDGMLLPAMTGADTLWITEPGTYECKVVNPQALCPQDTTAQQLVYDCGTTVNIGTRRREASWTLYPNPASAVLTLHDPGYTKPGMARLYSIGGHLVLEHLVQGSVTKLDIATLPRGLYYIRFRGSTRKLIRQ